MSDEKEFTKTEIDLAFDCAELEIKLRELQAECERLKARCEESLGQLNSMQKQRDDWKREADAKDKVIAELELKLKQAENFAGVQERMADAALKKLDNAYTCCECGKGA